MRLMTALVAFFLIADRAPATDPTASTVYVRRDLGGGRSECGTGTVIACEAGAALVLTNAHVAEDGSLPLEVTHNGKAYPATYVAGSRVTHPEPGLIHVAGPDLAIITVAAELPVAPIATDAPRLGARIRQWGFGGRFAESGPSFKVGSVTESPYAKPFLTGTLVAQPGDSGSGLFDDAGALVGVTSGTSDDPNAKVRAVPLSEVNGFLRRHLGRLFPRLQARIGGSGMVPDAPPVPKVPPAPAPAPPAPVSTPAPAPAMTYRQVTYVGRFGRRYTQWELVPVLVPTVPPALAGNCPGGTCPAPTVPRGLFR